MKQNNVCEIAAAEQYKKEGWLIADSGWPDFLLYRWTGGRLEVKFAEVKSGKADLRKNQKEVLTILSALAPAVVCGPFGPAVERKIIPPAQDQYFHRSEESEWERCPHQALCSELCTVKYHVCEPRG
jgi:hypothetical protein